ncbi:MAG: hypothetical protein PVS3B3_39760 [Ktedonobacteraceae bacterium]
MATHTNVALIIGGSRGIGAATALALAVRGYDIALTYRNKAARANEVASQITTRGRTGPTRSTRYVSKTWYSPTCRDRRPDRGHDHTETPGT